MMDKVNQFVKSLQLTLGSFPRDIEEQKTENTLPNISRGDTAKFNGHNIKGIITAFVFFNLFCRIGASGVNVTADSGQDVMLPCQTEPMGLENIYWQKLPSDWVVLHWSNGTVHSHEHDDRYHNRTVIDNAGFARGNLSLTIRNVNRNDTGIYQCIIKKTQHVTPEKYNIRLKINQRPMERNKRLTTPGLDKEITASGTAGAQGRHHYALPSCLITIIFIFICVLIWRLYNARG